MAIQCAMGDPKWSNRVLVITEEFGDLLPMVVDTAYFRFNGRINEHTYSMAMGSHISMVLANLFMEEFDEKAIAEALHPTKLWGIYI